jgi:pyruvyltransferase
MLKKYSGAIRRFAKTLYFRDYLPCFWSKSKNWGDALSPYLVGRISGKTVRYDENPYCWKNFVIGSILDRADNYSIIWGSGMISPDALPRQKPYAIHAVRGPLTRERLVSAGAQCPEVYGDPALLLPRFFNPVSQKKWKIGVIPHNYDQQHPWINVVQREDGVKVIDVNSQIEQFVLDLISCECILSSSLHGLICADSYGIPNRRMILHGNLIGGDFKFFDYYAAANFIPEKPIQPKASESAKNLIPSISKVCTNSELDHLLECCPFA